MNLSLLNIIVLFGCNFVGIDAAQYIVNGKLAALKQFPSLAFIEIKKFICAGTVISPSAVVTAAHCLVKKGFDNVPEDVGNVIIYAGIVNLRDRKIPKHPKRIWIHDQFNFSSAVKAFDIALVRLVNPFVVSDVVRPAKLPQYASMVNQVVSIAGWGVTEKGSYSQELRYVEMTLVNDGDCRDKTRRMVPGSGLCAIGINRGTCHGDSGAPFLMRYGNEQVIVGILSFSTVEHERKRCMTQYPSVATNIFHFLDWIEEKCH